TRVTAVPRPISRSASQPATSAERIIARFGIADTAPLPLSEKPCACMKYVGSQEYVNQAVQLVTKVVRRSAQTARSRSSARHGTASARSASTAAGGESGAQRDQSSTH